MSKERKKRPTSGEWHQVRAEEYLPEEEGRHSMNVSNTEAAEASIDQFIDRRAREKDDANNVEELWAESERLHRERRREENREAWRGFHAHMQELHAQLAAEHRAKAERLLGQDERTETA